MARLVCLEEKFDFKLNLFIVFEIAPFMTYILFIDLLWSDVYGFIVYYDPGYIKLPTLDEEVK